MIYPVILQVANIGLKVIFYNFINILSLTISLGVGCWRKLDVDAVTLPKMPSQGANHLATSAIDYWQKKSIQKKYMLMHSHYEFAHAQYLKQFVKTFFCEAIYHY